MERKPDLKSERVGEQDGQENCRDARERLQGAACQSRQPGDRTQEKGTLKPGELASRHGVDLSWQGEQLLFHIRVNGEDKKLMQTDRTPQGLAQADRQLDLLVASKLKEIESKFKVTFSQEGEDIEKQVVKENPDGSLDRGAMIAARAPRLDELYGIEAALAHAAPSHLTKDGKEAVKFYFLQEKFVKGDNGTTLANYVNKDKNGKPAVYFWPGSADGRMITEADLKKWGAPEEFSIESLLTHELAHNSQYRLDWDQSANLERFSNAIGWAPYEDPATHETIWLIKGKQGDYFKYDKAGDDWLRCNQQGKLLDGAGKPATAEKDAQHLSTAAVRDEALVRPPTEYFDNAVEMDAEGMRMFRVNSAQRQQLLETSPVLYRFIKEQDQADINLNFGTNEKGQPHKIRLPDGSLSQNVANNSKIVADFERASKATR